MKFSPPPPSPTSKSKNTVEVNQRPNPRQGRAHKFISFIVFLHVLKASASNGSKNKNWYFFGRKLWSGLTTSQRPPPPKSTAFFDAAPNFPLTILLNYYLMFIIVFPLQIFAVRSISKRKRNHQTIQGHSFPSRFGTKKTTICQV